MPPEVINILKVFLFNRLTHWYSDGYILYSHQEGFQNFRFQFIFHRVIHARKIFIIYYIINYLYGWFLRFQTNWNLKSETLPTCLRRGNFRGLKASTETFEKKCRIVRKKMPEYLTTASARWYICSVGSDCFHHRGHGVTRSLNLEDAIFSPLERGKGCVRIHTEGLKEMHRKPSTWMWITHPHLRRSEHWTPLT